MADLLDAVAEKPLKIINLKAENLKKLKAVNISPDGDIVRIAGANGAGKQQPVSEPVLTPKGWVPIGDIRIGDRVIGSSGFPVEVLGVFPQSERYTYRVEMADGGVTRCGPEHLWTVGFWQKGQQREWATLTTLQLLERGVRSNGGASRRFSIRPNGPVQFADKGIEVPIEPYALGIILGDGHIEPTGYATVTSWDAEILDALKVDGWRSGHELGTGSWSRPLRHLGLAGKRAWEKFVPRDYFHATVDDRLALLAGLLDSDGTADKGSWASFCTTSEQLARDVVELGLSVGWICKMRDASTKKYRYNGELKEGREAWTVGIKSPSSPFRLQRKTDKWRPSEQRGDLLRHIDSIEPEAPEDSVCIQVAANDGLYVTKDFIVTHNTTVLDSIWWTLAGAGVVQSQPIRKGEQTATIRLDLGEYIVTRRFQKTDDGDFTTSVKVTSPDGAQYSKAQNILNGLAGAGGIAFDPFVFGRMKPKDQFDTLRGFVPGVAELDKLDGLNRADFDKRTGINRDAAQKKAQAAAIEIPEATPKERINETEIVEEIAQVGAFNAEIERRQERREATGLQARQWRTAAQGRRDEAAELRARAEKLDGEAVEIDAKAADLEAKLAAAEALPAPKDAAAVKARLDDAKRLNALYDQSIRRQALIAEADDLEKQAEALTAKMAERTEEKRAKIAAAKMPVEGLGFGQDCITFNGVPFDQASAAEQLRVSIAIAMAGNARLKVILCRDASLLDRKSMQILAEMAAAHGFQVWIETVDDSGEVGIVMEDGTVASTPATRRGRQAQQQAAE